MKLCFEVFKHLTNLSTAGALVVLAVHREIDDVGGDADVIWLVSR